ncbi:MAG: amidohydrolase [Variovorax sp.]|nr:amidohydrolase [Variovorax sp.]
MKSIRAFPFSFNSVKIGVDSKKSRTLVVLLAACGVSMGSLASSVSGGGVADQSPAKADTAFINGKIITVGTATPVAQAFALKNGKFVAVGSVQSMAKHIGPATKVVDLRGRTVIPGLADSHLHTAGGGPGIDLSKTRSLSEMFGKISEAAKSEASKSLEVLLSNNDWHEAQLSEKRLPTAAELEAAAPGRPLILVRGAHSYFLNKSALAKYGITEKTPVPSGGAIPRDASGNLTGEVTGNARQLVSLPPSAPISIASLQKQQEILNSHGLTSIRIAGIFVEAYRKFQELRDTGKATLRYSILFRPNDLADFQKSIVDAGIKFGEGDEWVKAWGIKAVIDGGNEGALMTKPYAEPMGAGGTYFGTQVMPETVFVDYMRGINQAGWRAAVHAAGDAAVDQVLNGFEKINAEKDITRGGWTIEHAMVARPDQYPQIKRLNVRLSVQNHLYLVAPVLKRYWGSERASQVTPLKSHLAQGILVAGGTDSPVIPVNPFWAMYHFLTRDTISDGVYGKNEAVAQRDTVLRMMTINNAKLTDEEAIKGSIEVGKLADFVVLSADYMTIPDAEVKDLKAVAVYVGGERVYRASGAESL